MKVVANNLKPTFNFKKRNQSKEEGDHEKEELIKESPKEAQKQPEPYTFTTEEPVAKPFTRFKRHQPSQDVYSLTQPEEPKS